ncbi:MAG: CPBP family intramembrane metalloprotease [Eubacteriales bacterium]|nr:CPBP family intramembrane metalloprotease [Eubacteriales bacterium]
MGIHFGITQIVSSFALLMIRWYGQGMDTYYNCSILLIGISGMLTVIPVLYLYRRDRAARVTGGLVAVPGTGRGNAGNYLLLLLMGAAMAQFGNLIVAFIQLFLQSTAYQDSFSKITEGKNLPEMIYWIGIVAPVAEEAVFRWLIYLRLRDYFRVPVSVILSALLFGIYHGNVVQFIYATLLGCLFAYFMEMTGSLYASVLLHIGANVWSLVYSELGLWLLQTSAIGVLTGINFLLLAVLFAGGRYFTRLGKMRNARWI